MKIYLDDNFTNLTLAKLLLKAGHVVVRPADAGLAGASDAWHFEYAIRQGLVILTADSKDFRALHQLVQTCGGGHPGILLIRFDNDPTRDMNAKQIVSALGKLQRSGLALDNDIQVLNHWR
jgi:predicted nuclease of predicted toxin-antitoxin system